MIVYLLLKLLLWYYRLLSPRGCFLQIESNTEFREDSSFV